MRGILILSALFFICAPAFSRHIAAPGLFSPVLSVSQNVKDSVSTAISEGIQKAEDDWYDPNATDTNDESLYDEYGREHSRSIFRGAAKHIYGWLYNIVRRTTGMGNLGTSLTVLIIILIAAYFFIKYFVKLVVFLYWLLTLKPLRRYLTRKKMLDGEPEYFRNLPFRGDIFQSNRALNSFSGRISAMSIGTKINGAISAYTLRMINNGNLKLVSDSGKTCLAIGTAPEEVAEKKPATKRKSAEIKPDKIKDDKPIERALYEIYKGAAGEDGILQPTELKDFVRSNPKTLLPLTALHKTQSCKSYNKKNIAELYGLKKFLSDFTLIKDRQVVEVGLWNEYLVFATLFGIADKVRSEFRQVCPEYFDMNKLVAQIEELGGSVGFISHPVSKETTASRSIFYGIFRNNAKKK